MKFLTVILFLGISYNSCSQTLKLLGLYKNNTGTDKNWVRYTDYPEIKLRFKYGDTAYSRVLFNKKKLVHICINSNLFYEVFENKFLILSKNSPTKFPDGEAVWLKPRQRIYVIPLVKKKKRRSNILFVDLNGQIIISNAVEGTNLNKGRNFDLAMKDISIDKMEVTFIDLNKNEIFTMPLKTMNKEVKTVCGK